MADDSTIWITYAWRDNDEGDFFHLVGELAKIGVRAKYDKIALIPGQRLWEQIGSEIIDGPYSGWAYLLTPASLASEPCREELGYALYRALSDKGSEFPLIGLLHGVSFDDVPPPLKVRLCVNMASPDWREEMKAAVERRPPVTPRRYSSIYVWTIRENARRGVSVEVRPRFGDLMFWRFAVPADVVVAEWGFGPAGGSGLSGAMSTVVEGEGQLNGEPMKWFGSGDRLSPNVSAHLVLESKPAWVSFGLASDTWGFPSQWEKRDLS